MALFFITGIAGTGKSTILEELTSRGFEAYGVDEHGFAFWHNINSGYVHPKSSVKTHHRTPEFLKAHSWKISRQMVKDLAEKSKGKIVFLCGVAMNDDEIWDLFSGVFALTIDQDTLKHRLATRTTNDYGKAKHELELTLDQHSVSSELYKKYNYTILDATKPIQQLVDLIVQQVKV